MMKNAEKILEILQNDGGVSLETIAAMLGTTTAEAAETIDELEKQQIIVGRSAIINWEHTPWENVNAIIELKVTPHRNLGFDRIAERIYQYPQVKSLYLMSGAYDLALVVEGKTMKEIAFFVADHLASMEAVISTATHFVLKKYKEHGVMFKNEKKDDREVITI